MDGVRTNEPAVRHLRAPEAAAERPSLRLHAA